jgi:UDP-glucose 4-epimerase
MTILVTGGTGLVGSRLLRRFVDAGVDCRALVRPGKEAPAGATPVEGDLLELASLKPAVESISAIVHLAAVFRTQNEDDIWLANLDGTKNLIACCESTRSTSSLRHGKHWTGLRCGRIPSRPRR